MVLLRFLARLLGPALALERHVELVGAPSAMALALAASHGRKTPASWSSRIGSNVRSSDAQFSKSPGFSGSRGLFGQTRSASYESCHGDIGRGPAGVVHVSPASPTDWHQVTDLTTFMSWWQ